MVARERGAVRPKITARLADPDVRHEHAVAKEWGLTLGAFRDLPDDERDEMMAAASLICKACGNLRSVCSDPDVNWHPQESVCWASATQQWGVRRLQAQHKDFKADAIDHRGEPVMSPLDGVSVWVSDVDIEALSGGADEQDRGQQDQPD